MQLDVFKVFLKCHLSLSKPPPEYLWQNSKQIKWVVMNLQPQRRSQTLAPCRYQKQLHFNSLNMNRNLSWSQPMFPWSCVDFYVFPFCAMFCSSWWLVLLLFSGVSCLPTPSAFKPQCSLLSLVLLVWNVWWAHSVPAWPYVTISEIISRNCIPCLILLGGTIWMLGNNISRL